ncbi:MAG: FtsK/SpoIIIE domain-containing protein, partial [Planctomycetota bacterium]
TLEHEQGRFVWKDPDFEQLPLSVDPPPPESFVTEKLHLVGDAALDSTRVEVPFEVVVPAEDKMWSGDATSDVRVPLGRAGATRLQYLTLGQGTNQHALIAGKTGSGKSTMLHVLITNLALWYSPDQVEFYLVDFKKGVEFKTYATHDLPHARAVAIESDREFGLSVLHRLDQELKRRGNIFRQLGVQDLAGHHRASDGEPMPRTCSARRRWAARTRSPAARSARWACGSRCSAARRIHISSSATTTPRPGCCRGPARRSTTTPTARSRATAPSRSCGCPSPPASNTSSVS